MSEKEKTYIECIKELEAAEVYKGLLKEGMFAEKLPPIFTCDIFFDYCEENNVSFQKKNRHDYVYFETYRNTNVPRQMGIPFPTSYQVLCKNIRDNWSSIQTYFYEKCSNQNHKISRIHIRKLEKSDAVFEMNYKNWKKDGYPEPDLLIGSKYIVKADIAMCFPSIYSHSIAWAIAGKTVAKEKRDDKLWFNSLDVACRNTRDGETHGILIGPHASNLISEIILCNVDCELSKKWKYIRNIDDYTCFVESRDQAQRFIVDLQNQLHRFDLSINQSKTKILELPIAASNEWIREINLFNMVTSYGKIDFKNMQAFIDTALKLMESNNNDAAVLKYVIKVISGNASIITDNAREYYVKTAVHLASIYPYLIPLLDPYVFETFKVEANSIKEYAHIFWNVSKGTRNYEGMYYSVYFALKYEFNLDCMKIEDVLNSESCILKLISWMYYKKNDLITERATLRKHAVELKGAELDRNWIFVYEALDKNSLTGELRKLKNSKVTFIKDI